MPDDLVHEWVKQLPEANTAIVSLLGAKPDGMSEFAFYSFCSGLESQAERRARPSFQEWLDRWHPERGILVIEHPTRDFSRISDDALKDIAEDIFRLTAEGRTVILVDSGGETRTSFVCKYIRATEDSSVT